MCHVVELEESEIREGEFQTPRVVKSRWGGPSNLIGRMTIDLDLMIRQIGHRIKGNLIPRGVTCSNFEWKARTSGVWSSCKILPVFTYFVQNDQCANSLGTIRPNLKWFRSLKFPKIFRYLRRKRILIIHWRNWNIPIRIRLGMRTYHERDYYYRRLNSSVFLKSSESIFALLIKYV